MKFRSIISTLTFLSLMAAGSTVLADYDSGLAAYEAGDYDVAFISFAEAAEQNHAQAQARLGELFRDGRGTERDLVQAHMWMTIAYLRGESNVRDSLAALRSDMSEGDVALSERLAIEWVEGGVSPMHESWKRD
jgi:TPR repeat protein